MEENKPVIEPAKPTLETNKPDWTINDLYKNAWQIVKNNKVLWLFGMAVGAGGISGNYSRSIDDKQMDSLFRLFLDKPDEGVKAAKVLGASTNALSDTIGNLFAGIPPAYYMLLGLEVLFLIVVSIITSVIYSSWAHAALLEGIQTAMGNGKLTIRDLSEKAFGNIKSILFIQYIPAIPLIISSMVILAFIIFGAAFLPNNLKLLPIIILPIFIILCFLAFIILSIAIIWAIRIVVIDKKPARLALLMGYKIAKKKFWASVLLGIVNTITVGIIYIAILLPIMGIIVGGAFTISKDTYLGTGIIVFGAIFLMLFILASTILEGIIGAFKATVWSLAYNAIRGKYEK